MLAATVLTPIDAADVGIDITSSSSTHQAGRIFHDVNQDGQRSGQEAWLSNWVVFGDRNGNGQLDGSEQFTTTNRFGFFGLAGLTSSDVVKPLLADAGGITNRVTSEQLANTETRRVQIYSDVASHGNGSVIVWSSYLQDGSNWGVFGQQFDAMGQKIGPEFPVNGLTQGAQFRPSVSAFDNGDFVVAWQTTGPHAAGWDIYVQKFNADGTKSGPERRVNWTVERNQTNPVVETLSNGNYVVGWQGYSNVFNGGHAHGIFARVFNNNSQPLPGERLVSLKNFGGPQQFDIARLDNGRFAIVQQDNASPDNNGIYVRSYDAMGRSEGGKYLVNQAERRGEQSEPAIDRDAAGKLYVSWTSARGDQSGLGVFAQVLNPDLSFASNPVQVAQEYLGTQWRSDIVALSNGNFAVSWQGRGDNDNDGSFIREFNSSMQPLGAELRLSDSKTGLQRFTSIDASPNGITVAWHGRGEADVFGVYTRLLSGPQTMVFNSSISGFVFDDVNLNGIRDSLISGTAPDIVYVIDVSGSTAGSFGGDPVGDRNGDGVSNTILDAEIAGFETLSDGLINLGFGSIADVSIVSYSTRGMQVTSMPLKPNQDDDSNGVADIKDLLRALQSGGTTNFEDGLRQTINIFNATGTTPENGNVIFLSDGFPSGGSFTDEVSTLRGLANNIRAFGVGTGASLTSLQQIDPTAQIFTSTNELLTAFGGLGGGGGGGTGSSTEAGIAGATVFLDRNNNGMLDPGEETRLSLVDDPATAADETGFYSFDNLTPGRYTVRILVPAGTLVTGPATGFFTIDVGMGQDLTGFNFGLAALATNA